MRISQVSFAQIVRRGIVCLVFAFVFGTDGAHAQLKLGILAAPSVQTIVLQEATITEGYQFALTPEVGLRLRYDLGKQWGLRLTTALFTKGANLEVDEDSLGGHSAGLAAFRAYPFAVGLGAEYHGNLNDRFSLAGSLDFVAGTLMHGSIRMVKGSGKLVYKDFFIKNYYGIDLGLSLQYQWPNGIGLRFAPTIEVQLNTVYHSSFFKPKYTGFAPRLELYIPLINK